MSVIPDIPRIKAHWERKSDTLPYLVVPMSDHTVVKYVPEITQPKPVLAEKLDKFTELCVGYERKQKK